MRKFYITLSNGKKVRLFFKSELLVEFVKLIGKDFSYYTDGLLRGDYMMSESIALAWLMAIEGERLDGKELGLNKDEFGRFMSIQSTNEFLAIFPQLIFLEN